MRNCHKLVFSIDLDHLSLELIPVLRLWFPLTRRKSTCGEYNHEGDDKDPQVLHVAAIVPEDDVQDNVKSHQRSWWIVHTQPTKDDARASGNPTNAVGGSFILSLLEVIARAFRKPAGAEIVLKPVVCR